MAASAILTASAVGIAGAVDDDEFTLDLRVIELATPLTPAMCDTSDGCGSTCSTSACNTSSSDPA